MQCECSGTEDHVLCNKFVLSDFSPVRYVICMYMALSEGLFVSRIVFLLDVCAVYGLSCVTFLNRVMRVCVYIYIYREREREYIYNKNKKVYLFLGH